MARKKSKEELNLDNVELDENGEPVESKGSKLTSFLVGLVVVIIWLVIFALLIKMDVGGVGTMLRPYLKMFRSSIRFFLMQAVKKLQMKPVTNLTVSQRQ